MLPPALGSLRAEGRAYSATAACRLSTKFANIFSDEAAIIITALSSRNATGVRSSHMPMANISVKYKGKIYLQNGGKTYRIFVYFCLKDVLSCNNNYTAYPDNNGDEGRGNCCLCYSLELSVNQKNKLKTELFPTSTAFYSLDSCCLIVLILEKTVYAKFCSCGCELPEASHMLFAPPSVPVPSC